jgi:restriction endonuclease Mrr
VKRLTEWFGLTDEEWKELFPSGQQTFDNRVG